MRCAAVAVVLALGSTACGGGSTPDAAAPSPASPASAATAPTGTPVPASPPATTGPAGTPSPSVSASPTGGRSAPSAASPAPADAGLPCGSGAGLLQRPTGHHSVRRVSSFTGSPAVTNAALRKQADKLAQVLPKLHLSLDTVAAYRTTSATSVGFLGHGRVSDPYGKVRVNFTCSLLGSALSGSGTPYAVPTPGHPDPLVCRDGGVAGHRATDCVWLDDTFGNLLVLDAAPAKARQLAVAYRAAAERG